jgi:hypothetical protein|nr:MAG TPA: tail completion protein [Caudoviricetes sp.]
MLNEIIKGVAVGLHTAFGDGFKIYQDDVKQSLKRPCFFIAVLQPELSPLLATRCMNRNPLDIQYIPSDPGKNAEMFGVAGKLVEALAFITLPGGDLLHGTAMNYEVVDGVLHFFVNYNLPLVQVPAEETPMESLDVNVGTKKG